MIFFWSNKCRLDEHNTFISKTLEIVWSKLFNVYINQTGSKVISFFLFDEDVIVVIIILMFLFISSQFQNTTSVSAFIIKIQIQFNSIQFKIICIALFKIQSLQSNFTGN